MSGDDQVTPVRRAIATLESQVASMHNDPARALAVCCAADLLIAIARASDLRVQQGHDRRCRAVSAYVHTDQDCTCGHTALQAALQALCERIPT
jgi:hypothetical protein